MFYKKSARTAITAVATLAAIGLSAGAAHAGAILLVNGSSATSETGTTNDITNNLTTLHEAAGNTVTVVDTVPVSLAGYSQVWDLRFSNASALTTDEQNEYLAFLQAGGGMFLMGENSSFTSRNDSIMSFLDLTGAGTFSFAHSSDVQEVFAPFTGPNPIASDTVSFASSGGVASAGNCNFMTQAASGDGTGVACSVGMMSNALDGALTTIFDVNFMQGTYGENMQNFTKNLIGFVGDQVDPPSPPTGVPEPAALALFGVGLAGLGLSAKRRRKTA